MRKIAIITAMSVLLTSAKPTDEIKVGHIDNGRFVLTIDAPALMAEWAKVLGTEGGYSKMEIVSKQTLGERKEDCYLLLATSASFTSSARWLTRRGDGFFLFTGQPGSTDTLYLNYYISCTGSGDCEPNVMIIDGVYKLGCGTKLECSKEPTGCAAATAITFD